jgi:hypothetical protein
MAFSLKVTAQLPAVPNSDSLVKIINQTKYVVYFGTGPKIGNIGYDFTINVSSTGVTNASWINGSFKGQLYADGQCIGSWQHILDLFERKPMNFRFSPDGKEAIGQYTKSVVNKDRIVSDETWLLRIKKRESIGNY